MSDVTIIRHLPSKIDNADDPAIPFRVDVNLRPPEFMNVTFVMLYGGTEEIVVRGPTREAIDSWLSETDLRSHPRLRWIKITGPDGAVEEIRGR